MAARLLLPVLCLLCLCSASGQNLTGPASFVVDGSSFLNLTCDAQSTTAVDRYVWFTPGESNRRCRTEVKGMCSFQPQLSDDKQMVTCRAFDSKGQTIATATYTVNLKYPPTSAPNITFQKLSGTEVKATCQVSGGKPRVATVRFQCEDPGLADQADEVSEDGKAVTSSVQAKITSATAENIRCNCSANWDTQPALYTKRSTANYTDFEAVVRDPSAASNNRSDVVIILALLLTLCHIIIQD